MSDRIEFRIAASACAALCAGSLLSGCATGTTDPTGAARFTDVTDEAGLGRLVDRARHGDHFMPDSLAGGCAFLDYDGDGDLDIYLVNGYREPGGALRSAEGANRLYRQDAGRFVDVTAESGAGDEGIGMGVAAGDIDNDGDLDLYVTNYGPNALYRNAGDGTFTRLDEAADTRWGASAGFFDFDLDGDLDLFVTNYLDSSPTLSVKDRGGRPEYPGPNCCPGQDDILYRNEGDGRFTDVSVAAGLAGAPGKGLGLAFGDLDGNGLPDVFVANDGEANRAWLQLEPGVFADRGYEIGLGVNAYGRPEASMGVAYGDVNGDLLADLFLAHLAEETNTLYLAGPEGRFRDATIESGLGRASVDRTGFGTAFLDYDLDGDLDVLIVNGRVLRARRAEDGSAEGHWSLYAERNLLFENDGGGRFTEAPEACGRLCSGITVSRGLAIGDYDDDGDPDVLTASGDGSIGLYRNDGPATAGWLAVRALTVPGGRDAHGAVVFVDRGGHSLRRDVAPATSYLSSHDPRVRFGLGAQTQIDEVRIRWPGGGEEAFGALEAGRIHELVRGGGRGVR